MVGTNAHLHNAGDSVGFDFDEVMINEIEKPAEDVLCSLVAPGNVVPFISVSYNWNWLSRANIDEKMQTFLFV